MRRQRVYKLFRSSCPPETRIPKNYSVALHQCLVQNVRSLQQLLLLGPESVQKLRRPFRRSKPFTLSNP
ncbi:MAG: hypothetical protein EZS28_005456 [Streblomastix strix]|uniref:Uncharacterized protein n=1 Tax=Streblomastix strix TaxID=222440 RepID=A0A5J4WWW5_9EUKA|nr:MAG: hypothetical protein EZS28_005456 [Streblomastix strix]